MIDATLLEMREELDRLEDLAADPHNLGQVIGDLVMTAARCDVVGDEYDLCRYSRAVALAMKHAEQHGDAARLHGYAPYMIAILSELADLGNEVAAIGLNNALRNLPIEFIETGKLRLAERREARNGQ